MTGAAGTGGSGSANRPDDDRNGRTDVQIAGSADVSAGASLGAGTRIWHLAQVREDAQIGANCIIGRGAYIGSGVRIGENSKIQNYALVYEPARLGAGVFIGPAAVLTNDTYPRAVAPDGSLKSADDWTPVGVTIEDGAAIGARAVCVAPVTIGRWASIAAGAVVTKDVPAFALMVGVPARRAGWVGRAGAPLRFVDGGWICPQTGQRYIPDGETLTEVPDDGTLAEAADGGTLAENVETEP